MSPVAIIGEHGLKGKKGTLIGYTRFYGTSHGKVVLKGEEDHCLIPVSCLLTITPEEYEMDEDQDVDTPGTPPHREYVVRVKVKMEHCLSLSVEDLPWGNDEQMLDIICENMDDVLSHPVSTIDMIEDWEAIEIEPLTG